MGAPRAAPLARAAATSWPAWPSSRPCARPPTAARPRCYKLEDRVAASDGRSYTFISEIDPTLFTLLTLKERYRVVPDPGGPQTVAASA